MDKLNKNVEQLGRLCNPAIDDKRKRDEAVVSREKCQLSTAVADGLSQMPIRQHADYQRVFQCGVEQLFRLCDDQQADVRLVADDALNSLFQTLIRDGSVTRVHVELYRELKRNGASRCVRAALSRLALVCHYVRPNKCRVFSASLEPCFCILIQRPEESVQESCSAHLPTIIASLGNFFNEEECKRLIKAALSCLQLQSVVARRAAVGLMVAVCTHCRHTTHFTAYLFKSLLCWSPFLLLYACKTDVVAASLVPVVVDTGQSSAVAHVLGLLAAVRQVLPVLHSTAAHTNSTHSAPHRVTTTHSGATVKIASRPPPTITNEMHLQLLEVLLYYSACAHSQLTSGALECLQQLFTSATPVFRQSILDAQGFGPSRINNIVSLGQSRSKSGLRSAGSSLAGSLADLSTASMSSAALLEMANWSTDEGFIVEQTAADEPTPDADPSTASQDSPQQTEWSHPLDDALTESLSIEGMYRVSTADECTESIPLMSPTSEPAKHPLLAVPDYIGALSDEQPALAFAVRLVAARFILSGVPGQLHSDCDVRVSHKSLAMSVLNAAIKLHPALLQLNLIPDDDESQRVSDVLLLLEHSDQQLRSATAQLAAQYIGSLNYSEKLDNAASELHAHALTCLLQCARDEASGVVRTAVDCAAVCLPLLLRCVPAQALRLCQLLVALTANQYWLVKTSAVACIAGLELSELRQAERACWGSDRLQAQLLQAYVDQLLSANDARVRQAAVHALPSLCAQLSSTAIDTVGVECLQRAQLRLEAVPSLTHGRIWLHLTVPALQALHSSFLSRRDPGLVSNFDANLSALVQTLVVQLTAAESAEQLAGSIEGLCSLASTYPPCTYPLAWGVTRCSVERDRVSLPGVLLQLLYTSALSLQYTTIQAAINLIAHLAAGIGVSAVSNVPHNTQTWQLLSGAPHTATIVRETFVFLMRVLNVYWHVLCEQPVQQTAATANTSVLPAPPSLSPVKKPLKTITNAVSRQPEPSSSAPAPTMSSTQAKLKLGDFTQSPVLCRLHELLLGAYSNYKCSLEAAAHERFTGVLAAAVHSLGAVLELASSADVGQHADELLIYARQCMTVLPEHAVQLITQLLKALFGTNVGALDNVSELLGAAGADVGGLLPAAGPIQRQVNELCRVQAQATLLLHSHDTLAQHVKRSVGWMLACGDRRMNAVLKNSTSKVALTNYIRLFEPAVVQSLRLYTCSVGIGLQSAVLSLLSQLVLDRVNYTLLDTEHKFLAFLFNQLETIEEANYRETAPIVRALFEFFVLLSYEKHEDKPIVSVAKIIQLCDTLIASDADENSIVMPVLHIIVLDLFLIRPHCKAESQSDICMQQEVVVALLLKYTHNALALDLLSLVLWHSRGEAEQRWRKLSRDVADRVLQPAVRQTTPISTCWQQTVRPSDDVLQCVLRAGGRLHQACAAQPQADHINAVLPALCSSLLLLIHHTKETPLLTRLRALLSEQSADVMCFGDDRTDAAVDWLAKTQMAAEEHSAEPKLLACALYGVLNDCLGLLLQQADNAFVAAFTMWYSVTLTNMSTTGEFPIVFAALSALAAHSPLPLTRLEAVNSALCVQLRLLCVRLACRPTQLPRRLLLPAHHWLSDVDIVLYVDAQLQTPLWHTVQLVRELIVSDALRHALRDSSRLAVVESLCSQLTTNARLLQPVQCRHLYACVTAALDVLCANVPVVLLGSLTAVLNGSSHAYVVHATASLLTALTNRLLRHSDVTDVAGLRTAVTNCLHTMHPVTKQRFAALVENLDQLKASLNEDELPESERSIGSSSSSAHPLYQTGQTVDGAPSPADHNGDWLLTGIGSPRKLNALKLLSVVRDVIRQDGEHSWFSAHSIALAVQHCDAEQLTDLLVAKEVPASLFLACLRVCVEQVGEEQSPVGLYPAVVDCLSKRLAIELQPHSVIRLSSPTGQDGQPASSSRLPITDQTTYLRCCALSEQLAYNPLCAQLCTLPHLLYVKYAISVLKSTSNSCMGSLLAVCAACRDLLCAQPVADALASVQQTTVDCQLQLVNAVFILLVNKLGCGRLGSLERELSVPFTSEVPSGSNANAEPHLLLWRQMQAMLVWLERNHIQQDIDPAVHSAHIRRTIRGLILALCRLPLCVSLVMKAPLEAFRFGWQTNVKWTQHDDVWLPSLPMVPVHQLHNSDILVQYVWRLCNAGWINRQQFEEVWMTLLGVLSATPIGDDCQTMPAAEVSSRVQTSAMAVRCLSSLMLLALMAPTAGNPIASRFIIKHRYRQSPFVSTQFGRNLCRVWRAQQSRVASMQLVSSSRRRSTYCESWCAGPTADDAPSLMCHNLERLHSSTEWAAAQLSCDTLWSLTGILAEERQLLSSKKAASPVTESAQMASYAPTPSTPSQRMSKTTSTYLLTTSSSLDLVSCMHFLHFDLFEHWLKQGVDSVPLCLLNPTVQSMVILCDVYTERQQFEWLRSHLRSLLQSRAADDELLMQYCILGIIKATAVLGWEDANELSAEVRELVTMGAGSAQLSVRVLCMHALLYLLQSLSQDEAHAFIQLIVDHVNTELDYALDTAQADSPLAYSRPQSNEYQLVLWALAFFVADNCNDNYTNQHFKPQFYARVERVMTSTMSVATPASVVECIAQGVCNLLISCSCIEPAVRHRLSKMAIQSVHKPITPTHTLQALKLLAASFYTGLHQMGVGLDTTAALRESRGAATGTATGPAEQRHLAMEQLRHLFNRLSSGTAVESATVGVLLPQFLVENLNAGDVMNRVVSELLQAQQTRHTWLLRVIQALFDSLREHEASLVVSDWALLSAPTFTANVQHVRLLSVFVLSAVNTPAVRRLFPLLLDRCASHRLYDSHIDTQLLVFALNCLYSQLSEKSQQESLMQTIAAAAQKYPDSAYAAAAAFLSKK